MGTAGPSREDEAELVAACVAGVDRAWDRLVQQYAGNVLAAVRSALRQRGHPSDPALEDEVLADAFHALAADDARVLRSFRGESSLSTFVAVVASRRAFRALRERRRRQGALEKRAEREMHAPRPGELDPAERVVDDERREVILAAMGALSASDRLLLTLYYLDGRTYKEIASVTGAAETGVGTRIARARRRLGQLLEGRGEPGILEG